MLFTRCPECNTTFRVTDETLKKANGQVRCGRCASVFNAYAELHDPPASSAPEPVERAAGAAAAPAPKPAVGAAESASRAASSSAAAARAAADAERARAGEYAADAAPRAPDDDEPIANDAAPVSAKEVERVLAAEPVPQSAYAWGAPAAARPRSRGWNVAAAAALLLLGAQVVHHFRATIAGHPTFGPPIVAAYDALGVTLTPRWDVRQYEILDWVATAEPNARGLGSLKITARIKNRGPLRQPYPAIELRLTDRWDMAVGSRVFMPAEYLPSGTPRGRLMAPGETARAEIELVDPGPDAYGFELDVCIEVEASLVTCGNDEIFL